MPPRKRVKRNLAKLRKPGFTITSFETPGISDYVVAELRYESSVAYTRSRFVAPAPGAADAERLNQVLAKFDIAAIRPQFGFAATEVRKRVDLAAALPKNPSAAILKAKGADAAFRQSGFVQIIPKRGRDSRKLAAAFNRQKAIWRAYVAPRPVPAGLSADTAGTRLFEPAQGYLYSAPIGIGAADVWSLAGAKGKGVTICDIEGAWNTKHEDLPAGIPLIGGTMIADIGWRNHGTAVLGEMVALPDSKGCAGISHEEGDGPFGGDRRGVQPGPGADQCERRTQLRRRHPDRVTGDWTKQQVRRHAVLAGYLFRDRSGDRQRHHSG
jgi:hypothetical protein